MLRRRGVGDPGVVAQIAEPEDRLDPIGDAARDAAAQHPAPRVPAEISLDQGARDAAERRRFDREAKEGGQSLNNMLAGFFNVRAWIAQRSPNRACREALHNPASVRTRRMVATKVTCLQDR